MATSLYHQHRLLLDSETQIPAASVNGSRPGGPYADDANFDSNMVIILAALLCALICALGLNSIVRCALRCSNNRFVFESPEEVAERLAATGLKKNALSQIPVVVYGSSSSSEQNIPATDCVICLGEFVQGEKVRILPKCNHGFHVKCIDTWLVSRSSCPTCRQTLCDQNSASSNEEESMGGGSRSAPVYGSGGQHGLLVVVRG